MLTNHVQLYPLVLPAVTITAVEWDVGVFACVEGDNIRTGSLGCSSWLTGKQLPAPWQPLPSTVQQTCPSSMRLVF